MMAGDDQAHDHAAWFRSLDILVWAAVAFIVILTAEWLGGLLMRERIARGAQHYLAQWNAAHSRNDSTGNG